MRIAFYLNFVLISLKINLNHAENVELIVRNGRIWWPLGCLVYGAPMLDESSGNGILFGSEDTNISDVKFILFSKISTDRDEIILVDDLVSIMKSKFNPLLPTKFLIHGWRDNSTNAMMQVTKNGYFARSSLNNVIGVDWGPLADSLNYPMVAQTYVPKVGLLLAKFIKFLSKNLLYPLWNIQLIGHSLGAQVSAYAGQYLIKSGIGKLPVIVGLDPALPLFQETSNDGHLDASDANYVEIIHTAAGCKGFETPIGTSDFYPNFNKRKHKQPGCGIDVLWQCSHGRAYYYFAESLTRDNSFISVECADFDELRNENCSKIDNKVQMGGYNLVQKKAKGLFYLKTNDKSPFSL